MPTETTDFENPAMLEEFMPSVLTMMIAYVVKDLNSFELQEAMDSLEWEDESVRGDFCDRYDLGEAIYDGFDLYDIDVWKVLTELLEERTKEEKEAAKE